MKRLRSQPPSWEVRLEADGYTILLNETVEVQGRWSDVIEVFAYKDDLFGYDEICIGLRFHADGSYWWVGESHKGYALFCDELKNRFHDIGQNWFAEVAYPAFAHNRTTLWGESWSPTLPR